MSDDTSLQRCCVFEQPATESDNTHDRNMKLVSPSPFSSLLDTAQHPGYAPVCRFLKFVVPRSCRLPPRRLSLLWPLCQTAAWRSVDDLIVIRVLRI